MTVSPEPSARASGSASLSTTVPVAPLIPAETRPQRNAKLAGRPGLLPQPNNKIQTVYDIVNWAAEKYVDKPALGVRACETGNSNARNGLPGDSLVSDLPDQMHVWQGH